MALTYLGTSTREDRKLGGTEVVAVFGIEQKKKGLSGAFDAAAASSGQDKTIHANTKLVGAQAEGVISWNDAQIKANLDRYKDPGDLDQLKAGQAGIAKKEADLKASPAVAPRKQRVMATM